MRKAVLAICIEDEIYQERFVKCMMNHYRQRYELHIFRQVTELNEALPRAYDGYILGEEEAKQLILTEEEKDHALFLNEENKYEEVYKLVEQLELLLGEEVLTQVVTDSRKPKVAGVFSVTVPHLQIPFVMLLADIYGEQEKTILLDLQPDSGLMQETDFEEGTLGIEDVMTMVLSGNYSRSRLLASICHGASWDYVYPVRSSICFQELSEDLLVKMVDLFTKQLDYKRVIINAGEHVCIQSKLLALCDVWYLLYQKGDIGIWREKSYVKEMERRGENDIFHRIHRVEVPAILCADKTWNYLAEQWKWSGFGDTLRKVVMEEGSSG